MTYYLSLQKFDSGASRIGLWNVTAIQSVKIYCQVTKKVDWDICVIFFLPTNDDQNGVCGQSCAGEKADGSVYFAFALF
jgi:hypothetical protein